MPRQQPAPVGRAAEPITSTRKRGRDSQATAAGQQAPPPASAAQGSTRPAAAFAARKSGRI